MILFGPVNQAMFDWLWSGIHFMSGIFIGLAIAMIVSTTKRVGLGFGILMLTLWEGWEAFLRYLNIHHPVWLDPIRPGLGSIILPETAVNIAGDLLIGTMGLLIGLYVARWVTRQT